MRFDDNDRVRELVGEFGAHLKILSRALSVEVTQRGGELRISSSGGDVDDAASLLRQLYAVISKGYPLHAADVHHAIRLTRADPDADLASWFSDTVLVGNEKRPIVPRSANQRLYVEAMRRHAVTFGVGPAGTGKTFLATAMAVSALRKGQVKRIVLTRPAVEAGEKLGFLPGDLSEKVDPYLRPLFDALNMMFPPERVARLVEKQIIEVAPLAFMRGRTLAESYVLLDEAQNTTVSQMRMFLTRLGEGSRMVVNGDITQVDLGRGVESGMVHALRVLADVEEIGMVQFGAEDVVRHPMVASIIRAYETDDRERGIAGSGAAIPRHADSTGPGRIR